MNAKSKALLAPLAVLGAIVLLALIHRVDPEKTESVLPGCTFQSATGWHCPGCGATRATRQLLHGNLGAAMDYNALVLLILFLTGYGLLSWGLKAFTSWNLPRLPRSKWFWLGLTAVMVGFGILRNLPMEPFLYLAP